MAIKALRIVMDGVTGRLGTNQHLIRSVLAIRNEGGLLRSGDRLVPEPVHVAEGDALRSPMLEGAKDVQLTELCYQSDRRRRWIDVPTLEQSS